MVKKRLLILASVLLFVGIAFGCTAEPNEPSPPENQMNEGLENDDGLDNMNSESHDQVWEERMENPNEMEGNVEEERFQNPVNQGSKRMNERIDR